MGNGNSDVGTKTATRKPRQAMAQGLPRPGVAEPQIDRDSAKLKRPRISGAMQQQCGDSSRGNQSALQKFVQLVGYRDPNAQPRPAPVKR